MKKQYLTSLLLLGLTPFLTQCASQDEVSTLNYHLRTLNQKVEQLKEDTTVDQMQKRQANYSGLMDQLQADILILRSQLEENGHLTRMLQEQNKELQQAVANLKQLQEQELDNALAKLNTRMTIQEEAMEALRQARIDDAERRSKIAAKAAEEAMRKAREASAARSSMGQSETNPHIGVTAAKVVYSPAVSSSQVPTPVADTPPQVSSPSPAQTVTPQATDTSADFFSQGKAKFDQGQFQNAYTLFEKHISNKGSGKDTIPARYMMGECLFQQGEYDQAIIQYQQIISHFPGNPQAAKALLRQGDAFEQLSDNDTAKIIYKKVIASYGSTPEAETARKRMSSLD